MRGRECGRGQAACLLFLGLVRLGGSQGRGVLCAVASRCGAVFVAAAGCGLSQGAWAGGCGTGTHSVWAASWASGSVLGGFERGRYDLDGF